MTQLEQVPVARPLVVAQGDGERIWFLDSAMTIIAEATSTGGELSLIEVVAPAGFGPPLHVHHDEHEALYVLEGTLELACGSARHRAGAGAFAFLPCGVAHTFQVVSETPARFLALAVPGGLEGFFREVGRPPEGPGLPPSNALDIALLARAAARFNVEIVAPPIGSAA